MTDEGDEKIGMAYFDGNALPPEERLAAWGQLTPGYDPILPPGMTPADFHVECHAGCSTIWSSRTTR